VYVLGGIREHSLMNRLHEVIKRRRMKTGLCGIPESIEKDYPFLDRTAGFESGVEGA
jgi:6-phosphofructokinase